MFTTLRSKVLHLEDVCIWLFALPETHFLRPGDKVKNVLSVKYGEEPGILTIVDQAYEFGTMDDPDAAARALATHRSVQIYGCLVIALSSLSRSNTSITRPTSPMRPLRILSDQLSFTERTASSDFSQQVTMTGSSRVCSCERRHPTGLIAHAVPDFAMQIL